MTEQPITITRVHSDPPHFRAEHKGVFIAWSFCGNRWVGLGGEYMLGEELRAAFYAQILAPTSPEQPEKPVCDCGCIESGRHHSECPVMIAKRKKSEQPERAKVGQHILSELTGEPCEIQKVNEWGVYAIDDEGTDVSCQHGHYTIVPPPTATGDKITERDGVWEDSTGIVRVLVVSGSAVNTIAKDGLWFPPSDVQPHHTYTLISTEPADLTNGWKGGE